MITRTSLKHPTCAKQLRAAAFDAALSPDCCSYSTNHFFVQYRPNCMLTISDQMGYPITDRVIAGIGAKAFLYMHRLADALAQPATEKFW